MIQQEEAESAERKENLKFPLSARPTCEASVICRLLSLLELVWLKGHAELATKQDLQRLETIMAKNQTEVSQQLRDALAKLKKIETEQDKQAALIKALLEAATNQPNASDELTAAADALTAELEVSDAKVDDETAPTPEA